MRMLCKCGETLSTTAVPNDVELRVYTDGEWDKILENDMIETIKIPFPKYDVWRCPKCERVYVMDWGYGKPPIKVYKLEE